MKLKFLSAVALGVVLTFGGVCADNVAVNNVYAAEVQNKGGVDWYQRSISAVGIGVAPENARPAQAVALAKRAAVVDAQRNLLEIIKGTQIDSETVMQDLAIVSDVVTSKMSGLVRGAEIVEEGTYPDGSYFVKMTIPMYGVKNSLASVVVPAVTPEKPEALPIVEKQNVAPDVVKTIQEITYTGVVVDAKGLGLEPTFSPVIFDVNGRAVYGMKNIDRDFAISKGMVEYSKDLEKAAVASRAGSSPLIISAVKVRGGQNSVNMVNVVVSVEDGDKILLANEKSGMLNQCAVVFVR